MSFALGAAPHTKPHPAPPLQLSLHVMRNSLDLLDALAISVVLDNPGSAPLPVRFALPAEYVIDVLHGDTTIWTTMPQQAAAPAHFPVHVRTLLPGTNTLAVYDWNEVALNGTSPAPGEYTIRVRLLETGTQLIATTRVRFVAPTPVSAIAKLPVGDAITISGHLDPTRAILTDSTGSTTLSRRLIGAPLDATVAVRGYITATRSGARYLFVQRWAPLSAPPPANATPLKSRSSVHRKLSEPVGAHALNRRRFR
ncbi:MAG: hypothetical protein ACYDGM_05335 [Vulcanimicrobiaceae bacterium]